MPMTGSRFVMPASLAEAAAAVVSGGRPMAGGTGLQVEWSHGAPRPALVVDLAAVTDPGFRTIVGTRIGAGATLAAVEAAAGLPAMLTAAVGAVAAPNIRRLATIGGNIAGGTGCLVAPLLALDAAVIVTGPDGLRSLGLDAWLAERRPGEILTAVLVPTPAATCLTVQRKIGLRQAFSPSVIGVAAVAERQGDRFGAVRIAVGGGANQPRRLTAGEAWLSGQAIDAVDWRAFRDRLFAAIDAGNDGPRSGRYRRLAAANGLAVGLGGRAAVDALSRLAVPVARIPAGEAAPPAEVRVGRDFLPARWHPRPDGPAKIAGRAGFHTDRRGPAYLVGRILRAGVPHGWIRSIDTTAAEALPGVIAVVTARDVPGQNAFGIIEQDQPALCGDRVRTMGDPIAAVAAVDAATAARALALIRVEIEPLPVVDDPAAALLPEAAALHPDGNLRRTIAIDRGDIAAAFDRSAHIVEAIYTTPRQMHAFLETEGGVAIPEADGTLTVMAGSQHGTRDQIQLGRILDRDPRGIRVVSGPTGGAFGGKDDLTVQPVLALLALKSGQPVRLHLDRAESAVAGWKSMPFRIRMRTGCDASGRILAQDVDVLADCGAYTSLNPAVLETAMEHLSGPYAIEAIRARARLVSTNNGICGAFRGFGANQMTFAVECQVEKLAAAAGLDPVAMRRHNLKPPGAPGFLGQTVAPSERLAEMLTAAAASDLWARPRGASADGSAVIGVGMALNHQGNGLGSLIDDPIAVRLSLAADGAIEATYDLVEMGQGLVSVVAASVAAALGCARADVRPILADTGTIVDGGSTSASRGSLAVHLGAKAAGPALARRLVARAAAIVGRPAARLAVGPGGIRDSGANMDDGPLISFAALAAALGEDDRPVAAHTGQFPKADWPEANARFFHCHGATIARVAVDRTTGAVTVLDLDQHTAAGPIIDVGGYLGQIEGGLVQALGFSLSEHVAMAGGRPTVTNFDGYMVPMMPDAPGRIRVFALEDLDTGDDFGPRGVGELGMGAVTPALANAIADAIGLWPTAAPFSPETLLAALVRAPGETGP